MIFTEFGKDPKPEGTFFKYLFYMASKVEGKDIKVIKKKDVKIQY